MTTKRYFDTNKTTTRHNFEAATTFLFLKQYHSPDTMKTKEIQKRSPNRILNYSLRHLTTTSMKLKAWKARTHTQHNQNVIFQFPSAPPPSP